MNMSIPWRRIITSRALALLTVVVALVLGLYYLFSSAARPTPPPPGVKASLPFGAIDINELDFGADSRLQESIQKSLLNPTGWYAAQKEKDGDSRIDILALSGGGSRGAFGAGVLCGWSAAGSRPDFKIVTGVSTGALQSTFAFLGSEYDSALKEIYTQFETVDLYSKRSRVAPLYSDATNDSIGLSKVIEHYITAEVLEAVAKKNQQGYRLFVGTTNLDTTEFIIWNMGKIAASERTDALQHYRRVLLASASIPVFFPPVYFEVQANGQTYHEMHVDGSTYSNLVFRSFMIDIEEAKEKVVISHIEYDIRI